MPSIINPHTIRFISYFTINSLFQQAVPYIAKIIKQRSSKTELLNVKYFSNLLDPNITWKDIEWIKSITDMPIIVKGILRTEDACCLVKHGVQGVVISNHGGRQLDTTLSSIEVLLQMVEAIGNKLEILIDGGIRRGTDILKAFALGAKAVLVGRPIIWGLSVDGKTGVYEVLNSLEEELKYAMTLCVGNNFF